MKWWFLFIGCSWAESLLKKAALRGLFSATIS